jgi:putative transposase
MRRPAAFKLWQRDFWDTQMRDREHYDEKLAYVRMNPVRKGLVATPEEWPYQGVVHPIKGSHDDTSDYTCTG